jgi:hypothetical protein
MLLWFVAIVGALAGLAAVVATRRLGKKLDGLTQSYWELRYEYTRLRAELQRLDPDAPAEDAPEPAAASVSFVPLSSLKKGGGY